MMECAKKKNLYMAKNDKKRDVIKYMNGCSLYIEVSKSSFGPYVQVSFNDSHTCHRNKKKGRPR